MTRYFTQTHERIDLEADTAIIGITSHAVKQLGDVVFVEHLETEGAVAVNQPISVVESTKAASEIYAPLSGDIIEVNTAIIDNPELVSDDSNETVWFFKMKITNLDQVSNLLDQQAYTALVG